jgi:hypothetical protein
MITEMVGKGQERFSCLPQSSVQRQDGGGRQIPEQAKLWYNKPFPMPTPPATPPRLETRYAAPRRFRRSILGQKETL